MITIDKNVPLPKNGAGRPTEYPFSKMEVGDSFVVLNKSRQAVASNAAQRARRHSEKYATRKEESGKGIRVWRVE